MGGAAQSGACGCGHAYRTYEGTDGNSQRCGNEEYDNPWLLMRF